MTNYSLSNEGDILNRLEQMKEDLYRGNVHKEDVEFSVKTIRNLLLELYLVKQELNPNQAKSVNEQLVTAVTSNQVNETLSVFEANKPM